MNNFTLLLSVQTKFASQRDSTSSSYKNCPECELLKANDFFLMVSDVNLLVCLTVKEADMNKNVCNVYFNSQGCPFLQSASVPQ